MQISYQWNYREISRTKQSANTQLHFFSIYKNTASYFVLFFIEIRHPSCRSKSLKNLIGNICLCQYGPANKKTFSLPCLQALSISPSKRSWPKFHCLVTIKTSCALTINEGVYKDCLSHNLCYEKLKDPSLPLQLQSLTLTHLSHYSCNLSFWPISPTTVAVSNVDPSLALQL